MHSETGPKECGPGVLLAQTKSLSAYGHRRLWDRCLEQGQHVNVGALLIGHHSLACFACDGSTLHFVADRPIDVLPGLTILRCLCRVEFVSLLETMRRRDCRQTNYLRSSVCRIFHRRLRVAIKERVLTCLAASQVVVEAQRSR